MGLAQAGGPWQRPASLEAAGGGPEPGWWGVEEAVIKLRPLLRGGSS